MRIRSIKPDFWSSRDITDLSIEDRLLFIGLWSYVDDNGVGRDEEDQIVATLFARDMFNSPRETIARVADGLQRLSDAGLIVRYKSENRSYLEIVSWEKHQKIDRPNKARFPRYNADRDTLATHSRDYRETPSSGTEEQGNRGTGEQGSISCATADAVCAPDPKPAAYSKAFETFWQTYPLRKSKRRAYQRWQEALKRATADEIIAGAARYRDDPNREDRYTKYPEGWLSGNGWEDDPLPARSGNRVESPVDGWLALAGDQAPPPLEIEPPGYEYEAEVIP